MFYKIKNININLLFVDNFKDFGGDWRPITIIFSNHAFVLNFPGPSIILQKISKTRK